jgi:hypothetical protein
MKDDGRVQDRQRARVSVVGHNQVTVNIRTAIVAAAVAAILIGGAGPASPAAQAAVRGMRIYNYKKPFRTPKVQSYGKVRMCFNATGDHLYQGYRLVLEQRIGGVLPHWKRLWDTNYWGPKHKTCTPWKSAGHDKVDAWIAPVNDPQSHAVAQVWIYNP